jgi:hypothetical protein
MAGCVVGGLALQACAPKGTPPDSSSIALAAVPQTRWTADSAAWGKDWNQRKDAAWRSYDGVAFGPGSAYPATRYTLRNPEPGTEYLPLIDNPMFGSISQEEAPSAGFPAALVPNESYYVNGVDMGPSPDRAQAGFPVKAQ